MRKIFEDEDLRHKLAKCGNLNRFKSSYKNDFVLADLNSSSFWDRKIEVDQIKLLESPIYRDKVNIIYEYLRNKKGKLLDVGFGLGYLEQMLFQNLDLALFGLDVSNKAVKNARKNLRGQYKVGNIYQLPYRTASFDIVLALDILEHLPPNKVFVAYKEINRVLNDKGVLVVSVPLNEGLEKMIMKGKNPNGHLRVYTPLILKTELKLSGFETIRERYLFAFGVKYKLKSQFVKLIPIKIRKPNLLISISKKNEDTFSNTKSVADGRGRRKTH